MFCLSLNKRLTHFIYPNEYKISLEFVHQLILVSTKDEIEKFKEQIEALGGDFSKYISYMVVDKSIEALENLLRLKEILQEVGLMKEIG